MAQLFVRGETQEDIWDDSLIIKAYEDSMKLAREEVAKRIASSTNKGAGGKKNPLEAGGSTTASSTSQEKEHSFRVGGFCRATYEDGVDYEARIVSQDLSGKFLIKYVGYDNEQLVDLEALLPSWGKKQRKEQKLQAELERAGKKARSTTKQVNLDPKTMFPPPPPMPPMLDDDMNDAEHLSAMLMSWYMSGYYTGLYQGQKMARRQQN